MKHSRECANVLTSNRMVDYSTKKLSFIFKALGSERRMNIIKMLSKKPLSVIAISEKLNLSFRSVSKHLQRLDREGIITKKREGQYVYYRLTDSFSKSGVCGQILRS